MGKPASVPAGVIEAIISMSSGNGEVNFDHAYQVGDRVRLIAGPFTDTIAEIGRVSDSRQD